MSHKTAFIKGVNIHYWTFNEAGSDPIILVHGFRGNHKSLVSLAKILSEHRQVILFDLPGHGLSSPMPTSHTMTHFVRYLDDFIQHLNLTGFDLWAHSFGASIVLLYAAECPKGLQSITLASPAISAVTGPLTWLGKLYYKLAVPMPKKMQKMWLASPIIDRVSGELLIKNVSRARKRQLLEDGRRNLKELTPSVVIESSLSYLDTDFHTAAHTIKVPVLLIAGKLDQLVPLRQIHLLAQCLRLVSLHILESYGHLSPLEAPGTVARLTNDFLSKETTLSPSARSGVSSSASVTLSTGGR